MKLGELISRIEQEAGTSITDPRLLKHEVMLVNSEPTARPLVVVISDTVSGPVVYLTNERD